MKRFVFLDLGTSIAEQYIFSDCKKLENVSYINVFKHLPCRLERGIIKYKSSGCIPFCWLPIQRFVNRLYSINPNTAEALHSEVEGDVFLVLTDPVLPFFSEGVLEKYSDAGYKLCLLFLNSISSLDRFNCSRKLSFFGNRIFSFDEYDAKRFGFSFCDQFYSRIIRRTKSIIHGVYFIGNSKGRLNKILAFSEFFLSHGIQSSINVGNLSRSEMKNLNSNNAVNVLFRTLKYPETLKEMMKYDVILDIACDGQHGPSLRYYEAVVYNRKLISTNKEICKMRFYNPEFMKIVETPDQIDLAWLNGGGTSIMAMMDHSPRFFSSKNWSKADAFVLSPIHQDSI